MICCDHRALLINPKLSTSEALFVRRSTAFFEMPGGVFTLSLGDSGSDLSLLTSHSFSQFDYSIRCMFPKWSDWQVQYTRKGLLKERIRQGLNLVILAAMIVGLYQARRSPGGISALPSMLRQHFKGLIRGFLGSMNRGISRLQRSM